MNQREAKQIVYRLTAASLRNLARNPERLDTFREVPVNITDAGRKKVVEQMRDLAQKLEDKFKEKEPIEHEQKPTQAA